MTAAQRTPGPLADMQESVKHACPWSTTFLFTEPGCDAVGQETALSKAIQASNKRHFEIWESTWITPRIEDAIEERDALLADVAKLRAALEDARQALDHAIYRLKDDASFSTSIALKGALANAVTALGYCGGSGNHIPPDACPDCIGSTARATLQSTAGGGL